MPALRFKTCRLLLGNVWNRELSIIQRRILGRLRKQKRSIKRRISSREKLNSYIQSQTTRKLPLFHGNLPLSQMQRGRQRTSYIPFPLNLETRSDVIPVRIHFRETIPQARQPISHGKVCVNNRMVSIIHFKVSHGDLISFQEDDARTRDKEIRRFFYIEISVEKIVRKYLKYLNRKRNKKRNKKKDRLKLILTRRGTKISPKWLKKWKDKRKCYHDLRSEFFSKELRSFMKAKYFSGSAKVCVGCSFAEHNRMKRRHFYLSLLKIRNKKNRNLLSRTRSPILDILDNSCLDMDEYSHSNYSPSRLPPLESNVSILSILKRLPPLESNVSSTSMDHVRLKNLFSSPHRLARERKGNRKRKGKKIKTTKVKRIELPTHYSEVNYRTKKAVVSYGPNIGHIPHHIRLKDPNLLLRSGKGRGQNI